MNILPFQIGDLLFRSKGLYTHIGVHIGYGRILQNTPLRGEHVSDFTTFSEGSPVKVQRIKSNPFAVLERAAQKLANPKPYNLLNNNCEHTAYEVAEGSRTSPQLYLWLALGFLIFLIWACKSR